MAQQMSAESVLDDVTECSICTEVFTDPRVLPCIHTFCLKCLLNYGKDSQPGDIMPCPLCRKEFTIPEDGFAGTQKNFFMDKLLYARTLPAAKTAQHIPCDACISDDEGANETAKPATMYCVQCQQNYCDQCSRRHARMTNSADHVQTEIGTVLQKQQIVPKLPPATCDIHKGKEIEVFCRECEVAICMMCFIKSHKNHDCCDIDEVSADLRSQLMSDIDKITEGLKKTEELLPRVEKETDYLIRNFATAESEINRTADKLIDAIQRDRRKLLTEVQLIRLKRVKQIGTVKEEVEQHMAALNSFRRYCETLLSSGTACDVTRSAKSIHDRAEELTTFNITGHVQSSVPSVTIKFAQANAVSREAGNVIGAISFAEDEKSTSPIVTHVISKGNNVNGVTSLGDDIFVVRHKIQGAEVYDAVTFALRRCLTVPGLGSSPFGLAACAINRCIYISDFYNNSVHRVELSGRNAVMKWSVASSPVGLSVNSANNVLVVSNGECKLQEFTTRGKLVRDIQLQPDIGRPRHVVQLSLNKFLVSHDGSQHRVCLVDVSGAVICSYGGPPGSDLTKMDGPMGLVVDKHGSVLVAEADNNRLLVLDQSLNSAHEMSVSVDGGLNRPYSLRYDESRRRLYIGELGGGRVIVIDGLKDFSTSSV